MDQIKLRALRNVRRFNFERCNSYETVAEHSFFVATLVLQIVEREGWSAVRASMAMAAALLHDADEAVTGDLPYLVRKRLESLAPAAMKDLALEAAGELGFDPSFPSDVLSVVAYADALELAMYLREERLSGNQALLEIERETRGRLVQTDGHGVSTGRFLLAEELLGGNKEWNAVGVADEYVRLKH